MTLSDFLTVLWILATLTVLWLFFYAIIRIIAHFEAKRFAKMRLNAQIPHDSTVSLGRQK